MTAIEVTAEQSIAAPRDRVWRVITVPQRAADLDVRTSLVSAFGEPGVVGSFYFLDLSVRRSVVRQKIEVVESLMGQRLVTVSTTGADRAPMRQVGVLDEQQGATRLRWTVGLQVPAISAPLVRVIVRRRLIVWLGSVSAAATGLT